MTAPCPHDRIALPNPDVVRLAAAIGGMFGARCRDCGETLVMGARPGAEDLGEFSIDEADPNVASRVSGEGEA